MFIAIHKQCNLQCNESCSMFQFKRHNPSTKHAKHATVALFVWIWPTLIATYNHSSLSPVLHCLPICHPINGTTAHCRLNLAAAANR